MEKRFWSKVEKEDNECWEFTSYTNDDGYGMFWIEDRPRMAHRVSWFIEYGEFPGDKYILHHCDNPTCVNPDHLYIGDQSDNMQDREKRSEYSVPSGEEHPSSKLSDEDVSDIRRRYKEEDITQEELGNEYEIRQTQVSNIIRGENW